MVPSTWPQLTSADMWTSFQNTAPGTSPGSWGTWLPNWWTTDTTPDCTIPVTDAMNGLDVSTAQYQYSINGGSTWSTWAAATCTGSDGTTSQQTLTAAGVPFVNSGTLNKIRFRVTDMAGLTGTSDIYNIWVDGVAPGSWTAFSPTVVNNTLTPDCTVKVTDATSGLAVSSAEYQYSINGGSSWSSWTAAGCTGTSGTTAQQTLTANDVPFQQNSTTLNKIRFRITDTAGLTGTTGIYTVQIAAPVAGLPKNGNMEVGLPGQVPSLWGATTLWYVPGYGTWEGIWSTDVSLKSTAYWDGAQSVSGSAVHTPMGEHYYGAIAQMSALAPDDYTGVSQIELYMRDINVGETDPANAVSSLDCYVALVLSDGSVTETMYLYRSSGAGTITDNKTGTSVGADGQTWNRYAVTIPGTLNKANLRASVKWQALGNVGVGFVYPTTNVHSSSIVDGIRAVDGVAPASAASASGAYWSYETLRDVAWTASDNAELAAVEFWARNDSGSGWSAWVKVDECVASGRTASGTRSISLPGVGACEIYTRARDVGGNTEAAPGTADATCGVDRTAPGSWSDPMPDDWVNTQRPTCTYTVTDPLSGLQAEPVRTDSIVVSGEKVVDVAFSAPQRLWVSDGTRVGGVDASDPHALVLGGGVDLAAGLCDLYATSDGQGLLVSAGEGGMYYLDSTDVDAPAVLGALNKATVVEIECPDLASYHKGGRIAFAIDGVSGILTSFDVTDPTSIEGVSQAETFSSVPAAMASADGWPYIVAGVGDSLIVVDVTDPSDMRTVDQLGIGSSVADVVTDGSVIHAVFADGRIYTVTWSDKDGFGTPASTQPTQPTMLALHGSHVYAGSYSGGFAVVDTLDPDNPAVEFELPGDGYDARAIAAAGGFIAYAEQGDVSLYTHGEAMYSYSIDGGATWSEWLTATNPSGDVNTAVTLSAVDVPFDQDSATANQVRFRVGDAMGTPAVSPAVTVPIDTAIGTVTPASETHPVETTWYSANDSVFTWSAPSDLSGITGYSYVLSTSSSTVPDTSSEGVPTVANFYDSADGQWYFRIRACDAAGNWGATTTRGIRIDTTMPSGTFVLNDDDTYVTSTSVTCDSAMTDGGSGMSEMRFQIDSGSWGAWMPYSASYTLALGVGEGTRNVDAEFRDTAGNVRTASDDIIVDTVAPTMYSIAPDPQQNPDQPYGSRDVYITWTTYMDASMVDAFSYEFDQVADTTPDTTPDAEMVEITYEDLADGTYYFHIRPHDRAGNWGPTMHRAIIIDGTAPTGTMSVNSGATYTNSRTVNVNSAMTDASLFLMRISVDGGATWLSDLTDYLATRQVTLPAGDGTKTVKVQYQDTSLPPNMAEKTDTIVLDTTPPTDPIVTSSSHAEGSPTSDSTIDFVLSGATDVLSGVDGFGISLTRNTTETPSFMTHDAVSGGLEFTTMPVADGTWYLNVSTYDNAGNHTGTVHYGPIIIDSVEPTIATLASTTHPNPDVWYPGRIGTFEWSADPDGSGIAGYSYASDKVADTIPDEVSEGTDVTFTSPPFTDGESYFHVRALDGAGNWGPTTHVRIRVDGTKPSGTMKLDGGAATTQELQVTVNSSVTDVHAMTMRFSTSSGSTWSSWKTYAAQSSVTLPEDVGDKTVLAQYRDVAGNVLELSDSITLEDALPDGLLDRWDGADRYATACVISAESFPDGADTVVIATGVEFADALAASGLAGAYEAPLLLTKPTSLPAAVASEIKRLGVKRAVIAGGTSAVSAGVASAIDGISGVSVDRIAGTNRYETAALVADRIASVTGIDFSHKAFVARGDDFADALAVSPLAYSQGMPVLLVKTTSLPGQTSGAIARNSITECIISGGAAAVSEGVKAQIDGLSGVSVQRWYGADRYATAADVATKGIGRNWAGWQFVGVATGTSFPDALGGGVASGSFEGVLLMTKPASLSSATRSALNAHAADIDCCRVYGGVGAVTESVESEISSILH